MPSVQGNAVRDQKPQDFETSTAQTVARGQTDHREQSWKHIPEICHDEMLRETGMCTITEENGSLYQCISFLRSHTTVCPELTASKCSQHPGLKQHLQEHFSWDAMCQPGTNAASETRPSEEMACATRCQKNTAFPQPLCAAHLRNTVVKICQ